LEVEEWESPKLGGFMISGNWNLRALGNGNSRAQ
jgi:hypothetical protein